MISMSSASHAPIIDPAIFKAYDIRGIYPTQINEENIVAIIQSIYHFFTHDQVKGHFTIALGCDMRLSSPSLFAVAKKTLLEAGADIIDVGLLSTPTFYFAVSHNNYDAGIQITASHNPKEYNGVKIVRNSPKGLIKIGKSTGMDDIKKLAQEGGIVLERKGGSETKKENILEDEVENAITLFDHPTLDTYKIVADPANAMGATYIEALFKKIPGELIKMNFDLDGTFPSHQPDPLDFDNLKDLQKRVIDEGADLGLAPDGDGDRLFFIDERGEIVPATIITALVARELLKKDKTRPVLFDIRYILTPKTIIEELGGTYKITRVGHAYITEQLTATGGIFAGESSAHYYYRATGNAESQVATIISVLKVMTEEKKKLSELVEELRRGFESGEVNFKVENAKEIIEKLKEKYKDGDLNTIDGIAISYETWRFSVRTSNTEPLLRLNLESKSKPEMEEKKVELISFIEEMKR